MAVNRKMANPLILPHIFLVNANSHQMRHDLSQAMIVVALHPDHLNATFRIGQLANVPEKLPMFLGEAAEIQVSENVTQQDQPAKAVRFEHMQGLAGMA